MVGSRDSWWVTGGCWGRDGENWMGGVKVHGERKRVWVSERVSECGNDDDVFPPPPFSDYVQWN